MSTASVCISVSVILTPGFSVEMEVSRSTPKDPRECSGWFEVDSISGKSLSPTRARGEWELKGTK